MVNCRSPHGERGLKSTGWTRWNGTQKRRAPHGERGLKYQFPGAHTLGQSRSPHGERGTEFQKGSDEMDEMTVAELNQYLENIAKLIEASAQDVTAAAQIVRDSKVGA